MREIKFRGMDIHGVWHYGLLSKPTVGKWAGLTFISNSGGMPLALEVRPETVGQFTNVLDKAKKEIYEGDRVKYGMFWIGDRAGPKGIDVITFDDGCYFGGRGELDSCAVQNKGIEVIGNIHENPGLKR